MFFLNIDHKFLKIGRISHYSLQEYLHYKTLFFLFTPLTETTNYDYFKRLIKIL